MTQPAPQTAPAVPTGNSMTMILGVIAGILMVVGAFLLDWISGGVPSKGIDSGIAIFWSTEVSGDVSFFTSAGFVILIIAAISLIGGALGRSGWVTLGGILAVLAFVLVMISFYRVEQVDLGIGDAGLGLWAILVGGVVAIVAGAMGRRSTV
jgi:hypothetical protein